MEAGILHLSYPPRGWICVYFVKASSGGRPASSNASTPRVRALAAPPHETMRARAMRRDGRSVRAWPVKKGKERSHGKAHDHSFTSPRIFGRRKLDDPMLKPFGQVPVADQEGVRPAIPPDDGLRLRTTGRRAQTNDFPQGVLTRRRSQLAVQHAPRGLDQVAHVNRRWTPTRTSIRLVSQRPHRPPAEIGQSIQRRNLVAGKPMNLKPMIHKPRSKRIRQRIGENRR